MSLTFVPRDAKAFDYLEHLVFTDLACERAQQVLAEDLADGSENPLLISRYLALALVCPYQWEDEYCEDGEKQVRSAMSTRRGHSMTMGDFSALGDHVSRYGPIRNLPRAQDAGLVFELAEWLTRDEPPRRETGSVARDACSNTERVPWQRLAEDVERSLGDGVAISPREIPPGFLTPLARAPVPRGTQDPSTRWSFTNPHYLDLVLRNHNHFGALAHGAWRGFHAASIEVSQRSCSEVFALSTSQVRSIAKRTPGWEKTRFKAMTDEEYRRAGCALLAEHIRLRLRRFQEHAPAYKIAPVEELLDSLGSPHPDLALAAEQAVILDRTISALKGLVLQATGIHFLQDGLASGHMRTVRSRESLKEVRHDHDADNRDGIVAIRYTRLGRFAFVAFGDSHLLGPPQTEAPDCDWSQGVVSFEKVEVSDCLIRHQRGMVVAATKASILDWAHAGFVSLRQSDTADVCGGEDSRGFVCRHLPTQAPEAAGYETPALEGPLEIGGTLPVPPPDFSYESLSVRLGYQIGGSVPQVGVTLNFFQALDRPGHWLRSYHMGVATTLGDGLDNQTFATFSFHFHWRWSARFMLEAGPYAFAGLRGLDGSTSFFSGAGPSFGIVALPEGWLKIPLELGITYRLPLIMFTSNNGFFNENIIGGHWVMAGVGLAFMK